MYVNYGQDSSELSFWMVILSLSLHASAGKEPATRNLFVKTHPVCFGTNHKCLRTDQLECDDVKKIMLISLTILPCSIRQFI